MRNAYLAVIPTGSRRAIFCNNLPPLQACGCSGCPGFDREAMVRSYVERSAKELHPLEMLFKAVELKPLQASNTLRDINLKLGIRADLSDAIGTALSCALFGGGTPNCPPAVSINIKA